MERAHVNGVVLEYEVTGSGEPVLLISPVVTDGFVPPAVAGTDARRRAPLHAWADASQ